MFLELTDISRSVNVKSKPKEKYPGKFDGFEMSMHRERWLTMEHA